MNSVGNESDFNIEKQRNEFAKVQFTLNLEKNRDPYHL